MGCACSAASDVVAHPMICCALANWPSCGFGTRLWPSTRCGLIWNTCICLSSHEGNASGHTNTSHMNQQDVLRQHVQVVSRPCCGARCAAICGARRALSTAAAAATAAAFLLCWGAFYMLVLPSGHVPSALDACNGASYDHGAGGPAIG